MGKGYTLVRHNAGLFDQYLNNKYVTNMANLILIHVEHWKYKMHQKIPIEDTMFQFSFDVMPNDCDNTAFRTKH